MSKRNHKAYSNNPTASLVSLRPKGSNEDSMPSFEDIQLRAYQIYEEKGGSDLENWLEAERLLKEESHV